MLEIIRQETNKMPKNIEEEDEAAEEELSLS